MRVSVCKEIACNRVGEDFLAYSPLTGQTVVLNESSYNILILLTQGALEQSELLKLTQLTNKQKDIESSFSFTLTELAKYGFVYSSSNGFR